MSIRLGGATPPGATIEHWTPGNAARVVWWTIEDVQYPLVCRPGGDPGHDPAAEDAIVHWILAVEQPHHHAAAAHLYPGGQYVRVGAVLYVLADGAPVADKRSDPQASVLYAALKVIA